MNLVKANERVEDNKMLPQSTGSASMYAWRQTRRMSICILFRGAVRGLRASLCVEHNVTFVQAVIIASTAIRVTIAAEPRVHPGVLFCSLHVEVLAVVLFLSPYLQ